MPPLYEWNDGSRGSVKRIDEEGEYWVKVNKGDCSETDTIVVKKLYAPDIELGNDTTICKGQTTVIGVLGNQHTYYWNTGSTSAFNEIGEDGLYWVEAMNKCGADIDSIEVSTENCDCYFYIPNAFSPNNDQLNDFFEVKFQCKLMREYHFEIFNRWGDRVFETDRPGAYWDGKLNHRTLPQGVYIWRLTYGELIGSDIKSNNKTGKVFLLK